MNRKLRFSEEVIPPSVIDPEDLDFPAIWDCNCGAYTVTQFNQGGHDSCLFEFDELLMWVIKNKRSSIDSILAHHGFKLEKQDNPASPEPGNH